MQNDTGIQSSLKEAVLLSSAAWAVLAERVGGTWVLHAAYHLAKSAQNELIGYMTRPSIDGWLCGALSGGHSRSSSLSETGTLEVKRIFAFPIDGSSKVVLVGADEQSPEVPTGLETDCFAAGWSFQLSQPTLPA